MRVKKEFNLKSISSLLGVLILLEIILAFALVALRLLASLNSHIPLVSADQLLLLFLFLLSLNTLIILLNLRHFKQLFDNIQIRDNRLEEIEKLNIALRSQRHDFLNHIQVVYSLIELKEYEEVEKYLNDLYGDIESLNTYMKTDQPSINALLMAKGQWCIEHKISLKTDVKTRLQTLSIPAWELCRCIGNLIDNAFTAVENSNKEAGEIKVSVWEDVKFNYIQVSNNGDMIEKSIRHSMFTPGFTTKKTKENHGMGLAIIKEIMNKYKGDIQVMSSMEETSFTLSLPKVNDI